MDTEPPFAAIPEEAPDDRRMLPVLPTVVDPEEITTGPDDPSPSPVATASKPLLPPVPEVIDTFPPDPL
jgi:hypothetical protein